MSIAAFLLGGALFLYVMEMVARRHPPKLPSTPQEDTTYVDRFEVRDTGLALPPVARYLEFVARSGSSGGLIHNYVNRGMRLLAFSLRGISDLNVRVSPRERMQSALDRYLDTLQANPRWALDPKRVRPAMLMAVEIMESLEMERDPGTQALVRRTREAAMALPQDVSTLWQRHKVQDFFIRSGVALVALKERAAGEARGLGPEGAGSGPEAGDPAGAGMRPNP